MEAFIAQRAKIAGLQSALGSETRKATAAAELFRKLRSPRFQEACEIVEQLREEVKTTTYPDGSTCRCDLSVNSICDLCDAGHKYLQLSQVFEWLQNDS